MKNIPVALIISLTILLGTYIIRGRYTLNDGGNIRLDRLTGQAWILTNEHQLPTWTLIKQE